MLIIMVKSTLITDPACSHFSHIFKIKLAFNWFWIFIDYFSLPMEFTIFPISLIGKMPRLIVKLAETIHLAPVPETLIVTSILIEQFPKSMSVTLKLVSFISASTIILLNQKLLAWSFHLVLVMAYFLYWMCVLLNKRFLMRFLTLLCHFHDGRISHLVKLQETLSLRQGFFLVLEEILCHGLDFFAQTQSRTFSIPDNNTFLGLDNRLQQGLTIVIEELTLFPASHFNKCIIP